MRHSHPPKCPERLCRCLHCILLGLALIVLHGCAGWLPTVAEDPPARRQVTEWTRHNQMLPPFKGLMQIKMQEEGRTTSGRAAWAAEAPDRLRLEWLGPLGQPLFSLAGDGQTIGIYDVTDGKHRRFRQTPKALERLIGVPLGLGDLVDILAGRPPLPAHAAVRSLDDAPCGVVLENRWGARVAEVASLGCDHPETMTVYDGSDAVRYRIQWLDWQTVHEYTVPREIQVTSVEGDILSMLLERFWIDPSLPPETFVIASPP